MSYDYSENVFVQNSAGNLLKNELGWDVVLAYDKEKLGVDGTLGRTSHKEILFKRVGHILPKRTICDINDLIWW